MNHNASPNLFNSLSRSKGVENPEIDKREFVIEWKNILYMLSHDMKNPVTSAGGFLSRLFSGKYGSFTERQQDYLELIRDNLGKLDRLIKHLLDLLRFESKEYKLVLNPLNILTILSKNIEILKTEADKKNIKILFKEPENIDSVIYADAVMMNRVITNLLENAVKYTNQGGTITARLSDIGDDLIVQITDTGIGIPENHLPHIFDAFYRVSSDLNGSGLGLFIVKSIIEAHGGKVWVESIPGKGSSFSFALPKEIKGKVFLQIDKVCERLKL
jgi:two-component system phosphate regulon sensor histidine kinase PhoR